MQCYMNFLFYTAGPHANAGPPKKRHKGWSPESSANSLSETTVKTPPSSSALSTSSVPSVITNGARSGKKEKRCIQTDRIKGEMCEMM